MTRRQPRKRQKQQKIHNNTHANQTTPVNMTAEIGPKTNKNIKHCLERLENHMKNFIKLRKHINNT